MKFCLNLLITGLLVNLWASAGEVKQYEPTGSLPYLSVEESLKTFELP